MKILKTFLISLGICMTVTSCEKGSDEETRRKKIEALKLELEEINNEIIELEKDLQVLDVEVE